jgi:hypothetical protein
MATAALGLLAAALLVSSMLVGPFVLGPPAELAGAGAGADTLASMQSQVQHQLVEAAKRHALAQKHKTESIKLANAAQEEREQAELLKKRAVLAKNEAELEHASDEVHKARKQVSQLRAESDSLLSSVKSDVSKADSERERVMALEDKAGALSEKAAAEEDKIKVVEAKQNKAATALPKLLKDAEAEEVEASDMKAEAKKRMADSQRKAAAAERLDALAQKKEHDAHAMRQKLMGILARKAKILAKKEKDAARADDLAKKAAKVEADRAQEYAAEAAEKAELAKQQEGDKTREVAAAAKPAEAKAAARPSEADVLEARQEEEKRAKELADAEAADAADDADAAQAAEMSEESRLAKEPEEKLHVVAPRDPDSKHPEPSRAHTHAMRAINLQRAALEAARRRASAKPGRLQELADVSKSLKGDEVRAEEDGRLVVQERQPVRKATARMMEDGHYSEREEAFKRALAEAYRAGYDGAERQAELRAETTAKPARMQMLGDTSAPGSDGLFTAQPDALLSKGDGSAVKLEKESATSGTGSGGKARVLSMLWTDPGSLKADTQDLVGTTSRLHRYAPRDPTAPRGLPNMHTLYETGHVSREENSFKKEMGKYREALKQERLAHEDKVKRLDQELAQLPAAGRSTGDWKQDREKSFATMLRQPQNQWGAHGEHAYSHTQQAALLALPSVREDEEGHLVFDKRRRARMQLLHEYAGRRVSFRRGDGEGEDEHSDTVRRVREELARERRRERRLEDVTSRLQGEVDELRHERGGDARTEDLAQMRRESQERRDDERRRRRVEGARGRVMRYHERAHGARGVQVEPKRFHPDNTYNKEYAWDPGHVSVGEIKFQHALKDFDRTKSLLREGAQQDAQHFRMPQLVPSHLPGQGL